MKIEIPDWCDERHIFIMAGIEMVAYKLYGEDVIHIKKTRCVSCGSCCRNLPQHMPNVNEKGDCVHLGTRGVKNECGLGMDRPYNCSTGMQQKGKTKGCSIEYEVVKLTK